MKKRILLLMSVVALMVVMLAISVAPAFAYGAVFSCTNPNALPPQIVVIGPDMHLWKQEGYECHVLH